VNKIDLTQAILSKDANTIIKAIKNAPENQSLTHLIKDLRDSLGSSLEINYLILEWVIEELSPLINPIIKEYYISLIQKHLMSLGINPSEVGSLEEELLTLNFNYKSYEILKHTLPNDLFSQLFLNKFSNSERQKKEETEFYANLIHQQLQIPFFKILPNLIKLRLVTLEQGCYSNYFEEIINGVTVRTNVDLEFLLIDEFGEKFFDDIRENPKYSQIQSEVWKADLLAASGRATECYWDDNKLQITVEGYKILNIVYSPFWCGIMNPPSGLDCLFLP
jgi:hypothetical protein